MPLYTENDTTIQGVYAAAEILTKLADAEGSLLRQDFDVPLDGTHAGISAVLRAAAVFLLKIEAVTPTQS